jgi:hypothetical protein
MQLTVLFVMHKLFNYTAERIFTERARLSWFSLNWVHFSQNDGKSCNMWICLLYSIVFCTQCILTYLALIT